MMFEIAAFFIGIIFIFVIGVIIVYAVKGTAEWNANNHSPLLTVRAAVVAKRQQMMRHNNAGMEGMPSSVSTSYYVTFQLEDKIRLEFHVSGEEYGMLAEGDDGQLTYQGTRYQGFVRDDV